MKLNNIPDDPSPTPPVIESAYDDTYGLIPSNWTKVLSLPSGSTDMSLGSSFTTTYAVYANSRQYTGTYQGQVKYILTHPNSNSQHLFMQDVDTWGNTVLANIGDSIQAIDIRDGKQYWVTRLADGHIWMTQNLDFDITDSTLDSTTTDLNVAYNSASGNYPEYNDGYTVNNGIIYWVPAASAETIDFQNTGPITDWPGSNTAPYSANKTDSAETGHMSLGNYYNWTAAIASNDSSSLTTSTYDNITNNPKNSICPKGWRLPTISNQSQTTTGSTNEFMRLASLYPSITNSPLFFFKAGFITTSGQLNTNYGLYWSSTISGTNGSYTLQDIVNAANDKMYGSTVRCLAR